jgi:hypothetical protein
MCGRYALSAFTLVLLMIGCSAAPRGRMPAGCSGVPGDQRLPGSEAPLPAPTHGPMGSSEPIELTADARPFSSSQIPLLYIYDEGAGQVMVGEGKGKLLTDPAFMQVQQEAYWSEIDSGAFYRVPWLDKCSVASMVSGEINFHAPAGGLLFVQFLTPKCSECDRLTNAVQLVLSQNPELSVRWIRITVPRSVGHLTPQ